jgi:hypothetical protein
LPIGRRLLPLRILGYLAGAALLATFHAYVHQQLFTPAVPLWSSAYQSTFALNMVIVCVLVAIGHRRQLDSWLRARELASAALLDEVRETRARASRLQSIPPILLQALEHIATVARAEPGRAEQLLARLADYLRAAIESSDGGGITAARAAVMTSSLAELERAGGFVVTANRSA